MARMVKTVSLHIKLLLITDIKAQLQNGLNLLKVQKEAMVSLLTKLQLIMAFKEPKPSGLLHLPAKPVLMVKTVNPHMNLQKIMALPVLFLNGLIL